MSRLNIFAATSYGPHTALTGGRLRRDNLLAALIGRGHCVDRLDIPARPGARSALVGAWLALTRSVRQRVRRADVVLLGDVFCLPMVPVLARTGTPVVLDLVDSPYRLVGAAPRNTVRLRGVAIAQAAQLLPVMQGLLPMVDWVTYISAEDQEADAARVRRLPSTAVVSNGVNPTLFDLPLIAPPTDGYLAWLADWTYPPNLESFDWFGREVAPQLSDDVLARVRLFGAGDPRAALPRDKYAERVRQLVRHSGFVDPLSAVYEHARAVVAPVVRGAGVNNKVLEPLAAGRRVLTTAVGSRGLSRTIRCHLDIASDAGGLARGVMSLLQGPTDIDGAEAARAAVKSFSWEAAGADMETALLAAVAAGNGWLTGRPPSETCGPSSETRKALARDRES